MSLFLPPSARPSRAASARRDRMRGARRHRPENLETFESRQMLTVGLIGAGTASLTIPYFNGLSLSNSVGFNAARPVLSADGGSVLFGLDNSQGAGSSTIDIAT